MTAAAPRGAALRAGPRCLLVGSAAVLVVALLLPGGRALGAEPSPTTFGGDPRSAGEGPGFVGEPLLAIGVVVAIALVTVVATMVWVRATGGRSDETHRGS